MSLTNRTRTEQANRIRKPAQLADTVDWTNSELKMDVYSLFHSCIFEDVLEILQREYPRTEFNFRQAWDVVQPLQREPTECVCVLWKGRPADEPEIVAVDISGVTKEGEWYALGLTSWSEWLSMPIEVRSETPLSNAEILAHILWEMTWYGILNPGAA